MAKKNSRVSGRSNRKLLIGVAAVVVVVVGLGLIWAKVGDKASPPTTSASAGSSTAQQDAPKFTVTTNPPAGSNAAQQGTPQFTVTMDPPAPIPATGSPAPDFTLQDLNGRSVQLSKLRGKVVVINFWATWCGPCRLEIPGFVKAYEKYRGKGLEIVGISINDAGPEVVGDFVKKNGVSYPVALDNTAQIAQRYGGVMGIPTTFIIDRQGRIAQRHVGYMDQASFENMITPLL